MKTLPWIVLCLFCVYRASTAGVTCLAYPRNDITLTTVMVAHPSKSGRGRSFPRKGAVISITIQMVPVTQGRLFHPSKRSMNKAELMALLMIGGVELNPGPGVYEDLPGLTPDIAVTILNTEAKMGNRRTSYGKTPKSHERHMQHAASLLRTFREKHGSLINYRLSSHLASLPGENGVAVRSFLERNNFRLDLGLPATAAGGALQARPPPSPPSLIEPSPSPTGDEQVVPVRVTDADDIDDDDDSISDISSIDEDDDGHITSDDEVLPEDLENLPKSGEAFVDALRQMAIETGASYADVDTWLKILHNKKAQPNYKTLPEDSRTMFNPSYALLDNLETRDMMAFRPKVMRPGEHRAYDAAALGKYVYFGLKKTLMADSPGQYLRRAYMAMLKRLHTLDCNLLPTELCNAAYDGNPPGRESGPGNPQRSILFTLKVFTDGAPVFMNSAKSSLYPLLVSVHSVCAYDETSGTADKKRGKT